MAIELVPLCTMRLTAKAPIEIGAGPAGIRMIFDETSVEVHGDRLRGQLEGSASDYVLLGPEGTGTVDVRVTLRTDDGATIFVQYQGPTTGGRPIYDGRFNLAERKPIADEQLDR